MYDHPDDVDLTVGGSLEAHVEGTLAGPTFLCILLEQFYRTRVADKYFFERADNPGHFSPGNIIITFIIIISIIYTEQVLQIHEKEDSTGRELGEFMVRIVVVFMLHDKAEWDCISVFIQ